MILLVKPEAAGSGFSLDMALKTEPLELEYIKAMLKEFDVESIIYEASFDRRSFDEVFREYTPDAVAVTGYITQENIMLSYVRRSKELCPGCITMVGGSHAQLNPERFFDPAVSYICRSDNIYAIADVLMAEGIIPLKNGSCPPELSSIDGLCYQEQSCLTENGTVQNDAVSRNKSLWCKNPMKPFDINKLPIPDRTTFSLYQSHYRYLDVSPVALLKTSSSCPFHCAFCYGRQLNCGTYCQRDLEAVIEELETIPCDHIQIADDDFLFDVPRLKTFIRLLRERNIKKTFICYGRSDFIAAHESLIRELAEAGFRYIMVGLEAVSDSFLDSYQKHSSQALNIQTIRILHKYGINLVGLFIIDSRFKKEDFRNMRRFIHAHRITYTGVSIFTPIPGTPLFNEYRDRLTTENYEKWDFMHLVVKPECMSRFHFYFEYYLLIMDLFRIAQKAGIYSFLRLKDYKNIFLKLLFTDSFKLRPDR